MGAGQPQQTSVVQSGPPGPQGQPGPQGPLGPLGPQGPIGLTGPAGPMGQMGPIGTMGPIGLSLAGPAGEPGLPGPQGPQGIKGDIGLTGPMGTMGPIGLPGRDSDPLTVARSLMLQNTFLNNLATTLTSTSGNFYKAITGQTGSKGDTGAKGDKGDDADPGVVAYNLINDTMGSMFFTGLSATLSNPSGVYSKNLIGMLTDKNGQFFTTTINTISNTAGDLYNNISNTSGAFYNNMSNTSNKFYNNMINTSGSFYTNVSNTVSNSLVGNASFNNSLSTSIGNNLVANTAFNAGLVTTIGNNINGILSSTSGSFYTNIANNVSNSLVSNNIFNTGISSTVGNNLVANSSFINNLAGVLSNTSGNYYKSFIGQPGPPGDIVDPASLEKSMIPKTMWCTNGTFENQIGTTMGALICRTPFSTDSKSIYQIGRTPVYDSSRGTYLTESDVLKIGDWIVGQTQRGNLEFVNTNPQLKQLSSSMPILKPGFIIQYASSTPPDGWLLCDGSAVSRTIYAALFSVIGTTHGSGDGSTTFNLPDLRGRVAVGAGQGSGLTNRIAGSRGGAETHTLTTSEMPSHNHSINDPGHRHDTDGSNVLRWQPGYADRTAPGGNDFRGINPQIYASTTGISINNAGGNGAHNNMQPFTVINFIIKV